MRNWFFSRFENPAENCPYDEGEYIYIYGGHYYANEEITAEFEDVFPEKVISELVEELDAEGPQWSAIPTAQWYKDYEFEIKNPYENFNNHMHQVQKLLKLDLDLDLRNSYNKMIYGFIITALETYLKDKYVLFLFKLQECICSLLLNNKEIKEQKFTLSEINNDYNFTQHKIQDFLSSKTWHNLNKVNGLYYDTFKIK